jgi:hypothetical protein
VIEGNDVTIMDMGNILMTGKLEVRRSFMNSRMSNGKTVGYALDGAGSSISIINIIMFHRCYNFDSGNACKYCGFFARPLSKEYPASKALKITKNQVEATVIAIQNGWRGTLSITGGALHPSRRKNTIDFLEMVMDQLSKGLDDKTLSQLHIAPNVYPPDDLEELERWKDIGINAAEFDCEVMDPAYFKAICPGKSKEFPQEHIKEAQEAAVEVFGRGRGSIQSIVTGIEPMDSLVEGVEERISKGVYSAPLVISPYPGSHYEKFRPPTADWFVEVNEKIADAYFKYANTLDVNLLSDNRPGFTRIGLSYPSIIVRDEITRRLQVQGKFPAGLPSQDFIEEEI